MAEETTYRFFVEPINDNASEMIAEWLTAQEGISTDHEIREIQVGDKIVEGVYVVKHSLVTRLSRSVHIRNVRVYVQQDAGRIRLYKNFLKMNSKVAGSPALAEAQEKIAALPRRPP